MDDTLTIELKKPVAFGDAIYDKLELCEPTAGELEKATEKSKTDIGLAIELAALVAKVPRKVAEAMSQTQIKQASAFFGHFGKDEENENSSPT